MNKVEKLFSDNNNAAVFAKNYLSYLSSVMDELDEQSISSFTHALLDTRNKGAKVFFIGNGGSAATSDHFANDLAIGTRSWERPLNAISLASNVAILSCIGNDYGYDQVFKKQLEVQLTSRDLVVAISVSGNSPNVVEAIKYAKERGALTVGLTGFEGGILSELVDIEIRAITNKGEYGPAEDVHMILCHLVSNYIICAVKDENKTPRETLIVETTVTHDGPSPQTQDGHGEKVETSVS